MPAPEMAPKRRVCPRFTRIACQPVTGWSSSVASSVAPDPSATPVTLAGRRPPPAVAAANCASWSVTIESLLVSIAAPGLRDVGVAVGHAIPDAELQLYALLSMRDDAAATRGRSRPASIPPMTGESCWRGPRW